MPEVPLRSSSRLRDVGDRQPAVRLAGVRKEYRLYDSVADQALDVLGVRWLRFWRTVRYRTFAALDGIDLEVRHGERVGIIGRNGAGKTTLLKLITGNFAPTAGTIDVDGAVQALMQTGLGFHGEFTGMENIRSSLVYNGVTGDELEAAVEDIVDFCELGDFLHQPVKTYSLGMRARLQFATATAIKPDVVIIDEVLGAGDAYFAGKSNERIQRLTGQGATLLIVSHSMAQILQFSNRAIWMEQGRIVAAGTPLEIVNKYEEFIHRLETQIVPKSPGSSVSGAATAELREIPSWIFDKHKRVDGMGADWGGDGPLRVHRLGVIDRNKNLVETIGSSEPFGFVAEIASDEPGTYACSCLFVMYNEAGDVMLRVVEPERDYSFDGNTQRVTAWFDTNPIGAGKYLLSAGLYRDYDRSSPARGHRYHILSRGYQLRITSPDRDTSKIRLTPVWKAENSVRAVARNPKE